MKHSHFIFCILFVALAINWWGCSSSTPASNPTPSGSLTIPTSINFGNTRLGVCADSLLGAPRDSVITMANTGNDTVRIHSAVSGSPVFSVVSLDSVIAPATTGNLRLSFCPSQPGIASTTLIVSSNASKDSTLTIAQTGNGIPYSPGLHSQYTYTVVDLDTAGNPVGAPFMVIDSVIATGLTYEDSSNVIETSDTNYFIIENNGNASVYATGFPTSPATSIVGSGWQTLPFASHDQNIQLYSDNQTYIDTAGNSITLNIHDSASYVATSLTTISGFQVQESHVHLVEQGVYTSTKGSIVARVVVEIFYSPDLGTIVSQTRIKKKVVTAGKTKTSTVGGQERNLISFQEH